MNPDDLSTVQSRTVEREADLLDQWETIGRAAGWSDNTVKSRRYGLKGLADAADTPLTEVTTLQVARWLGRYAGSPWTRRTYASHCRSFFGWLQRSGYRADDPTDAIPRPRQPRAAPRPVSTGALIDALDGAPVRVFAYISLGAYAGLRVHEIAKVRGEDIDIAAGTLRVCGKGSVEAVIPLHPRLASLARHYPTRGYWFPGSDNGHLTGQYVGEVIVARFAEVAHPATAHQLRHWFGTNVLRAAGGNLLVAQQLLRHASPATTASYCMVESTVRSAALAALP
jgi:integrase/recombinase XerD